MVISLINYILLNNKSTIWTQNMTDIHNHHSEFLNKSQLFVKTLPTFKKHSLFELVPFWEYYLTTITIICIANLDVYKWTLKFSKEHRLKWENFRSIHRLKNNCRISSKQSKRLECLEIAFTLKYTLKLYKQIKVITGWNTNSLHIHGKSKHFQNM